MNNLKILVVDDDTVTLSLLGKKLKKAEHEVETAGNGSEAVDLVSNSYYDVVITDLKMPGGVDGLDVLDAVKTRQTQTEVILLTGYASVETAVEAMKKGAIDYLQKPINFDELFLRLDKISNLKNLIKSAGDLRDAMEVTEGNAVQTIQNLEMEVSLLQGKLSDARHILLKKKIDEGERVKLALDIMS